MEAFPPKLLMFACRVQLSSEVEPLVIALFAHNNLRLIFLSVIKIISSFPL